MDILRKERGQYPLVDVAYLPVPCMQCDDAPCLTEDGAIYKREDGIVLIDLEKAKGRKDLLDLCPYGAMWWNEEVGVAQKCTFCAHLLDDGWAQPRCVQSCPTGAMRFLRVDDAEMKQLVDSEDLEYYYPEYQTRPHVYYRNLYRYTRCFIGGNVALQDVDECAEGAQVTCKNGAGQVVGTATADNYGDFKVDGLEENSGEYSLEVEYPGYQKQELQVDLQESVNVGTIFL